MAPKDKGNSGPSAGYVAVQEFTEVIIMTLLLVFCQILLSPLMSGMTFAACLYVAATVASNMFYFDSSGVRPRTNENLTAFDYMTRSAVNFGLMASGLILWFLVGILHGVETTIATAKSPDEILNRMVGNSFPLRVIYSAISHITLFSFCRFCVNIYGMFHVMVWGGSPDL
ncbi:hypothetical protein Ocin01_11465 [Orchesella cincta]|uniref:Uncharacterized protein n=1 Tax=Orchesella cincta TaxID=48709 RepID=A0A1D2MQ96_ORCCI|nr:hypothetical protein Ocin01_11465 [Orchesella cincta]